MPSLQQPLGTGLGPFTTAEEVANGLDLSGKTAVVTGGASNLGRETVKVLSSKGARVVVPARDPASALHAIGDLSNVEILPMDLLDSASIAGFAAHVMDSAPSLDLLILSAGVMASPLSRDAEGHEGQFATNHLGHFRLTAALWPALLRAAGARVVILSSRAHQLGGLDLSDLDFRRRVYDKWLAYGQAKTANVLFSVALDARGAAHDVRAFSVHPGSILGPLARHLTHEEIAQFGAVDADGSAIVDPGRDLKSRSKAPRRRYGAPHRPPWTASAGSIARIATLRLSFRTVSSVGPACARSPSIVRWRKRSGPRASGWPAAMSREPSGRLVPAHPQDRPAIRSASTIARAKASGASCGRLWPMPPSTSRCS